MEAFKHTPDEFSSFIGKIENLVAQVSAGSTNRTLTDNLLYWMTYTAVLEDGEIDQSFQFAATVEAVFDRLSYKLFISDDIGECDALGSIQYNNLDGTMKMAWSEKGKK